ncbi:hypothetical protein GEMRC1_008227 [Eukaryota sp. GEM-RC1]
MIRTVSLYFGLINNPNNHFKQLLVEATSIDSPPGDFHKIQECFIPIELRSTVTSSEASSLDFTLQLLSPLQDKPTYVDYVLNLNSSHSFCLTMGDVNNSFIYYFF